MNGSRQREEWLNQLMPFIRDHFKERTYTVPPNVQVSCGFPSRSALGQKKRRIGEAWCDSASTTGDFQIFISPLLDDPTRVVGVQIHEVVHVTVGLKYGHKRPFAECAAAVGLVKPWTATSESPELVETIKGWIAQVGPYPHGALKLGAGKEKTEKGRLLLMECRCGLKIRTTQKWLDQYGPQWPCPCGEELQAGGPSEEGDPE